MSALMIHSIQSIEVHWNHPFLAASALFLTMKTSDHGAGYRETWANWLHSQNLWSRMQRTQSLSNAIYIMQFWFPNFPIPELIPLASLCSIEGIVMIVPIVSSRSFQEIQHAKEPKFPKQIFNLTSIIRWFGSFCSSIVPQDRKSSLHLAVAAGILETLPNDSVTVHSPIAATAVTAPSAKPGSPLPTTHHPPPPTTTHHHPPPTTTHAPQQI